MASGQLRVLFIGGTGTISASCVRACADRGIATYVLNRGQSSSLRPLPPSVGVLTADINDAASVRAALGSHEFDVVVNFLTFTAAQAAEAAALFDGRTAQYVHISTAAMYHKPVRQLPIVESTARHNPFSRYAQEKIAAEDVLLRAYADQGFPVTIVRPSHTYDDAHPPLPGDWTIVDRICRGAEIVVPGDGTSLWTLTHAADFAVGLAGLLGHPAAIGEVFHITADDVLTWDQIYQTIAAAVGVPARLVHVPSEFLPLAAPGWLWSELITGDLQYSALFDNAKIRRYVPEFAPRITFAQTVPRILAWRAEHPANTGPDPATEEVLGRLVSGYHEAAAVFAALGREAPAVQATATAG
jgi:nucleoside-diphosphate-sugar epimerase